MLITGLVLLMVLCNHSYKAFGASYFCSMLTSFFFFFKYIYIYIYIYKCGVGKGEGINYIEIEQEFSSLFIKKLFSLLD